MNFVLGVTLGALIMLFIAQAINKKLRVVNMLLRNESDYYYIYGKLLYKSLSSLDQHKFDISPETIRYRDQYFANEESIRRTGRY